MRGLLPDATLCFMHPVKPAEAIARGVSRPRRADLQPRFGHDELDKIVAATSIDGVPASDLTLCVRLRVSSAHAKLSLAAKFGVGIDEAAPCCTPRARPPTRSASASTSAARR